MQRGVGPPPSVPRRSPRPPTAHSRAAAPASQPAPVAISLLLISSPLSGRRPVVRSRGHTSDATRPGVSAAWRPCNGSISMTDTRGARCGRRRWWRGSPGAAPRVPPMHRRHPAVRGVGEGQPGRGEAVDDAALPARPAVVRAQHRHPLRVAGRALAEEHRLGRGDGRERAGVRVERGDVRERAGRIRPASARPPPAASRRPHRRWCRRRSPGCRRPSRPGTAPRSTAGPGTGRSRVNQLVAVPPASSSVLHVAPPSVERSTVDPAPATRSPPDRQIESAMSGLTTVQLEPPSVVATSVPGTGSPTLPAGSATPQPSSGPAKATLVRTSPVGSPAGDQVSPPFTVRSSDAAADRPAVALVGEVERPDVGVARCTAASRWRRRRRSR